MTSVNKKVRDMPADVKIRRSQKRGWSVPGFLAFEQLAVGGDLQLEAHLAVHDRLQFAQDRLELAAQPLRLASQHRVLRLHLSLAVFLGAAQRVDLALQLLVLQRQRPSASSSSSSSAADMMQ